MTYKPTSHFRMSNPVQPLYSTCTLYISSWTAFISQHLTSYLWLMEQEGSILYSQEKFTSLYYEVLNTANTLLLLLLYYYYIEIGRHRGMIANAHIKIGSNSYEKVKTFKYLGSLLT